MVFRLIVFLVINFAALGIGVQLMDNGATSDWYLQLNKAPWTPPGWVFGAAWTSIMISFALYMTYAWEVVGSKTVLLVLFVIQWVLNTSWNPLFFRDHHILFGLVIIVLLTLVVTNFLFTYFSRLKTKSLLVVPYFLWLLIATSLNAYIFINN